MKDFALSSVEAILVLWKLDGRSTHVLITIRVQYKTNSLRVDSEFAKQHFNDKLSSRSD